MSTRGESGTALIPVVDLGTSWRHKAVAWIAATKPGARFVGVVGPHADPTLMRLSRGAMSLVWPFPTVLLTHTGAKSRITRTSALVYFTDSGRVVIIGSNFGAPRNPSWYHNVKANPIVTLYARGISGRFAAQEVTGAERDRLFGRAAQAATPYSHYEEASGRDVPVIVFSPV